MMFNLPIDLKHTFGTNSMGRIYRTLFACGRPSAFKNPLCNQKRVWICIPSASGLFVIIVMLMPCGDWAYNVPTAYAYANWTVFDNLDCCLESVRTVISVVVTLPGYNQVDAPASWYFLRDVLLTRRVMWIMLVRQRQYLSS